MFRILAAVDGSASAERAIDAMIRIAKGRQDATITLLNVEPVPDSSQTHGLAKKAIAEHLKERAEAALAAPVERLRQAGFAVETRFELGEPAPTIVRIGEQEQADLIVMGTRGMSAVAGLLMGSVATKVLHHAKVPVLLVK